MARNIRYHDLFACEVLEAADWYERHSLGLGNAFKGAVEECVQRIFTNPEWHGVSSVEFRYARLKKFPYLMLFDVTADEILLAGILHTSRSLETWKSERFE